MNIDDLASKLAQMGSEELDQLLNQRDELAFDNAWCEADKAVPSGPVFPNDQEVFITISNATKQHEICTYISDDLNLIHRKTVAGTPNEFVDYLITSYEKGEFPSKWSSR